MKIAALNLLAFGPFRGLQLNFGTTPAGFQLLYGPNEAGKSSALRAIRQLLFGMDHASKDAFLHPTGDLRLGGLLCRETGEQLEFVRRKALKSSLRTADDQTVLADEALENWLRPVDAATFSTMLGIDHARLRQGGEEMLKGEGHLAEAIFAAASGVSHLRTIVKSLEEEYQDLYIPRGRSQKLLAALKQLKELRDQIKSQQLSSEEWQNLDTELRRTQTARQELQQRQRDLRNDLRRIERYQAAQPAAVLWKTARQGLLEFTNLPALPTDFGGEVTRLVRDWELLKRQLQLQQAECDQAQSAWMAFPTEEVSSDIASAITQLTEAYGSYRKAEADIVRLQGEIQSREQALASDVSASQSGEVAPNSPASLPSASLPIEQRTRIRELGPRQSSLQEKLRALTVSVATQQEKFDRLQAQAGNSVAPPETSALTGILATLRQYGDVQTEVERQQQSLADWDAELAAQLKQLSGWQGEVAALIELMPPSEAVLAEAERRWNLLEARQRSLETESEKQRQRAKKIAEKLARLEHQGAVPTLQDVQQQRQRRDQLWDEVRLTWSQLQPYQAPLAAEFSAAVRASDELADQLRLESSRVIEKQKLLVDQQEEQHAAEELAAQQQELSADRTAWQQQSREQWSFLSSPLETPAEMSVWVQRYQQLLRDHGERRKRSGRLQELTLQLERAQRDMAEAARLCGLNDGLQDLSLPLGIARLEGFLANSAEQRRQHLQLLQMLADVTDELAKSRISLEHAQQEADEFQRDWARSIAVLGLPPDSLAAEVFLRIDAWDIRDQQQQKIRDFEQRIKDMTRDGAEFRAQVAELFQQVLPEESLTGVDDQVRRLTSWLNQRQSDWKTAQIRRQDLEKQQASLAGLTARFQQLEVELNLHCQTAECPTIAELLTIVPKLEERANLQRQRQEAEEQLARYSAGRSVEEFVEELSHQQPDELAAQQQQLIENDERLTTESSTTDQKIGELQTRLSRMQGQGDAATLAAESQLLASDLQEMVRRYAVSRLSAAVLQRGMERYRERHQGPILSRASQLFQQLTGNSFREIRSEFSEKGEPILVGIRSHDDSQVRVDSLSDGTCDQLYLALRLAGLENWLDEHGPMPFIVDDILLNFDDERSAATLQVLGELARRTQVIFLTHHQRLIDLASAHVPAELLGIHRLQPAFPKPAATITTSNTAISNTANAN